MSGIELKGFEQLNEIYDTAEKPDGTQLSNIRIELLQPSQFQPRREFDNAQLHELSESIKNQGVIQPIIVRYLDHNKYEIIAGERRWRAAKLAGLDSVPAITKKIDDNTAHVYALIENIQRQDLNPIEEAYAFCKFRDDDLMSHAEIAKLVGKSRAAITNSLRLLNLDKRVMNYLISKTIDMGHARAVLSLSPDMQVELIEKIIVNKLSVRQTERLVSKYASDCFIKETPVTPSYCEDEIKNLQNEISNALSVHTKIKLNNKGKGSISLSVESVEEIKKIITLLVKQ